MSKVQYAGQSIALRSVYELMSVKRCISNTTFTKFISHANVHMESW